ncbi:MAG: type II toxin-antitoxin system HicB family antitoxin [Gammaproteobacteria bacterium]|nr:type II toxin-antitoxin system HicB family antitoxin [Gammaproteobacteria bacterium]
MKYKIRIEEGPNNYSAYSPDVPGCVSTGKTRAEVTRNFRSAVEFHLGYLLTEEIRQFAGDKYIKPLWKNGGTVEVRAGDIHRDMKLDCPMRAVCGALDTKLFREFYNVDLISRKGPHQGADTLFKFKVHPLHQPRCPAARHA